MCQQNRNEHIICPISEPCTGFPSTWQNVQTMAESTTPSGTSAKVDCKDSRVNKGSTTVTCDNGKTWTYDEIPHCVHRKSLKSIVNTFDC